MHIQTNMTKMQGSITFGNELKGIQDDLKKVTHSFDSKAFDVQRRKR